LVVHTARMGEIIIHTYITKNLNIFLINFVDIMIETAVLYTIADCTAQLWVEKATVSWHCDVTAV
jgi:hypothetical protein